jgi:pyrroline-5-carboxylate reductase
MKLAMLGTGNMGSAILAGLRASFGDTIELLAWDARTEALRNLDVTVTVQDPVGWFTGSSAPDAVIVAVKPYDLAMAIEGITAKACAAVIAPLWISIAAGKTINSLQKLLPEGARICRVMPNTPALIGKAMSAYALSDNATPADAALAGAIFGACGTALPVAEKSMNAITGLSGSGPAYVFYFIESLIEAGIMAGLPADVARTCALQTVIGSAAMAAGSKESLPDLIRKVMTPGGTTAHGLMALERHAVKDAVIKAVFAATKRSEALEN